MAWPGVRGKKETGVTIAITRTDETSHGAYRAALPGADRPAELTWRALGPLRIADHTFVPSALRGQGVAQALVEALVADARAQGFKVVPQCSYVAALFRRHPEWSDLLAEPDS
jgi:predicted GNAT family acetyltransferase